MPADPAVLWEPETLGRTGASAIVAALIAAAASPLVLFTMGKPAYAIAAAFMTALIFIRHRANIDRLMKGLEPKIGAKKAGAA